MRFEVTIATTLCLLSFAAAPTQRGAAVEVGRAKAKSLVEASGLAASRAHDGVFWTHNDGDDATLFALRRDGSPAGKVRVDAKFIDCEDIAADADGHLYLADTGNNTANRKTIAVHQIAEPKLDGESKAKVLNTWRLTFPEGGAFDCESLFIWQGSGYLISKSPDPAETGIYRFSLDAPGKKKRAMEKLITLPLDEPVTAAAISPDGKRLAVLGRGVLSVFPIDGDVKKAAEVPPTHFAIPHMQFEGCSFTEGGVLIIAETGEIHLVRIKPQPASQPSRSDQ